MRRSSPSHAACCRGAQFIRTLLPTKYFHTPLFTLHRCLAYTYTRTLLLSTARRTLRLHPHAEPIATSCNHRLHSCWSHVAGTGPWSRIPLPQCQCATLVHCPPPCRSRPPETSTRAGCAAGLVLYTIGTLLLQPFIPRLSVQLSSCTLSCLSPTGTPPIHYRTALRCAHNSCVIS